MLKPRHSGFYRTVLEELLGDLGAETLVLSGLAGNICVQMTAHDALLRNFRVIVPRDACASNEPDLNDAALEQMRLVCKADVPPAAEVDFEALKRRDPDRLRIEPGVPERGGQNEAAFAFASSRSRLLPRRLSGRFGAAAGGRLDEQGVRRQADEPRTTALMNGAS